MSAVEAEWGVKDRVFERLLVEVDEPDGGVRRRFGVRRRLV